MDTNDIATEPFPLGSHLMIRRMKGLYDHHGIYCGAGRVVHFDSSVKTKFYAVIRETSLERFGQQSRIEVITHDTTSSPEEIVARAESRVGQKGYGLFWNNCEHFANWCIHSESRSEQVRRSAAPVMRTALRSAAGSVLRKGATAALARSVVSPWQFAADGTQFVAEHTALCNGMSAEKARTAGRAAGLATSATVGFALGGPVGLSIAAAVWTAGTAVEDMLARVPNPNTAE
ncbi:lecithin retinol acyltransferase family protein [Calycomorphotria hydatis]|uniref:NC domain protein n=1 Tax=Calycomorphotria hydatis TaxID=2528027 RepID=A0A517TCK2_9PLAN|nr:lecithin retinol acyltransferase family protein [Calycomorphotria hydatis]QDT66103.1 NC domain protein [Calycomorphotria hydatis]